MKFISKDEFLKQPKEIQDKIKELWNPEQWDLFTYRYRKGNPYMMWRCEDGMVLSTRSDVWIDLDDDIIPLLTIDKMIEMIERIAGMCIEIMVAYKDKMIDVYLYNDKYTEGWDIESKDRLHALWEVLTELAKENL